MVKPLPSLKVQRPFADLAAEGAAKDQLPLKARPSELIAAQLEAVVSFSLKESLVWLLTTTSEARTHPVIPALVRTMYQIS